VEEGVCNCDIEKRENGGDRIRIFNSKKNQKPTEENRYMYPSNLNTIPFRNYITSSIINGGRGECKNG
jgi:hypothetical protein